MVESLHTQESQYSGCYFGVQKDSYINGPKGSLIQFTIKKRNYVSGTDIRLALVVL